MQKQHTPHCNRNYKFKFIDIQHLITAEKTYTIIRIVGNTENTIFYIELDGK